MLNQCPLHKDCIIVYEGYHCPICVNYGSLDESFSEIRQDTNEGLKEVEKTLNNIIMVEDRITVSGGGTAKDLLLIRLRDVKKKLQDIYIVE